MLKSLQYSQQEVTEIHPNISQFQNGLSTNRMKNIEMKKWLLNPADIDINQKILEQLVIIYKVWHG